jgi:hypothetical protein
LNFENGAYDCEIFSRAAAISSSFDIDVAPSSAI